MVVFPWRKLERNKAIDGAKRYMDGARGDDVVKSTFMIMIHGDKSEGFTNEGGLATILKELTSFSSRERKFSATISAFLGDLYRPIPICPIEELSMCCLSKVVLRPEPIITCPYIDYGHVGISLRTTPTMCGSQERDDVEHGH